VRRQVPLRPAGGDDLEAERLQRLERLDDPLLVGVAHRNEHGPGLGRTRARAQLALGEGDLERTVDAHHLAGRAHFRAQHRVHSGETGEREHGLLDPHMIEPIEDEIE
jgi:hypothetical protein